MPCARCGSTGRPAARRLEGVICYACYAKDPEAMERCAACDRLSLPAIRQEDGTALCVNCWHRPERECGKCGEVRPVKTARDGQIVCESCYRQPGRLCGRCGRIGPIALRATESTPALCQNCYQGVVVAWAAGRRLAPSLTVPQRSSRQMPAGMPSEEDLGQQLQRCLTDATVPVDVRAAGAIVTLFGLPLSKIVQLTAEHLIECGDDVYLTMDKQPVLMPPRLAALLHAAARASSRSALGRSLPGTMWLFPGFSPGRHQVANTLSRRLREHGIQSRSTRNTAIITLASDLPAPVLADLLGLHITTAERWVGYARRDWITFLAARDGDQSPQDGRPSVTRSDTKRSETISPRQNKGS